MLSNSQGKINISFSIARVFAILSIVAAHVSIKSPELIAKIVSTGSSIGVITFIILSGYFYHSSKYNNVFSMLKGKAAAIFCPWLFMGSAVYLYNAILSGGGISPIKWILYIIGYKTYLYYLTVLVLCYLIFYKRNRTTMYISMGITAVSLYLTAFGIVSPVIESMHLTDYLNIFNWVGYFAAGCLMQEISAEKILVFLRKTRYIAIAIYLAMYAVIVILNIPTGYFSYIGMPYQLIGVWCILGISTFDFLDIKLLHKVSNMTFGVYLLHMIIIGLSDRIYMLNSVTKLISPVIVAGFSLIVLYIGYFIASKIKLGDLYCTLTGIRMKRDIKSLR